MFHSAEIRWFFAGRPGEDEARWIDRDAGALEEPVRTDAYLVFPGCTTVGVKVRQGNLEVKALTRTPEPVEYASGASGYRGAWVKWSAASAHIDELVGAGERRAFVEKRRTVRLMLQGTSASPETARGCRLELTNLRVLIRPAGTGPPLGHDWADAEHWWTFGLEAFGPPGDDLLGILDANAAQLTRGEGMSRLKAEASFSYPGWLDRLCGSGD